MKRDQVEELVMTLHGKLEHNDIFHLCKQLKKKHLDMYFEKKEGEFQKKWNIWKDNESLSSMCNIDDKDAFVSKILSSCDNLIIISLILNFFNDRFIV